METRSKSKRIGPLPGGDRRGASGAGAGCDSIRTVSGEELNRRALSGSPESTTANVTDKQTNNSTALSLISQTNSLHEPFSASSSSHRPTPSPTDFCNNSLSPVLSVAQEVNSFLPASTKAGKSRVRMKWTADVNEFIMRTYYIITKLETDMTCYRQKLYDIFIQKYPNVSVTEQRISDQRRMIIRNKYLSQIKLDQIKDEVTNELIMLDIPEDSVIIQNTDDQIDRIQTQTTTYNILSPPSQLIHRAPSPTIQPYTQTSHSSTQTELITLMLENETVTFADHNFVTDKYTQTIHDKFKTILTQYSGMDPTVRPKLPKLKYSEKLNQLTSLFNSQLLNQYLSVDTQLIDIHTLVYCTALVISEELNYKIIEPTENHTAKNTRKPPWQVRLEKDIEKLRADCGRLTQYINNNRSNKVVKRVEIIFKNTKVHTKHESNNKTPQEYLDTLKQKLTLKAHRLKRYKKAQQRRIDNCTFTTNEKVFYRNLSKVPTNSNNSNSIGLPTKENLEEFWSNIWEETIEHNKEAGWIKQEKHKWQSIETMEFNEITESDILNITAKLHNWKSPGVDKIHNYWYKKLTILHKSLAKNISEIVTGQQNIPEFIATGITYMLPKNTFSPEPSQYRPITCLPTLYKIITSAITAKINSHIERHNIIAEEQKGCRRNHRGCKEQLIIDSTIHKHAATKNRNLHCTYIDYKKAFDSIPHSWLIEILHIYKINSKIIDFLCNMMLKWKTNLQLNTPEKKITTRQISIKKGIYQGDSLSPLWFCLCLNPLSHLLNSSQVGYRFQNSEQVRVSHLIYMDDIKLYSSSQKDMNTLINTTSIFSKDIKMQFGLDKCKTLHIIKGKVQPGDCSISDVETITAMTPTDLYKYLGYKQLKGFDHTKIKNTLRTEYKNRVHKICKSQLNGKNLIKALNTYAIPILTYSFGIIKWTKTDLNQIERNTRTILTKNNHLHPKSAIERLTIKRQEGGRGLIDISYLWEKQIHNLKIFFLTKSQTSHIHKTIVQNDHNFTPLNLTEQTDIQIPTDPNKQKVDDWKRKVLHGRHPHDIEQNHIDTTASNSWLKIGNLFPETEGFLIAIQDQVINTKNYRKYIIKDPKLNNDKCRKCNIQPETIQHITGACTNLSQTDYTHRHNQLANIIHQKLAIKHQLVFDTKTPYYKYIPQTILENNTHKLYFDRAILTDKTIHYNRPDITLQDKINKITYLIDIAVPNTHNLQKTISEKISKYTDLREEIIRIWKQNKVYVVPIVLSTTGVIPKPLHNSLKLIDLPEFTYIPLQKAAILNTCRIVRKFMQIDETDTYSNSPPT